MKTLRRFPFLLSAALIPALALADSGSCGGVTVGTPGLGQLCSKFGGGNKNPIYAFLAATINYLLTIITAVAVLAIVIGAIQYITSQGNPDAVKKAKGRITNAVIGLILLSLTFVILKLLGVVH